MEKIFLTYSATFDSMFYRNFRVVQLILNLKKHLTLVLDFVSNLCTDCSLNNNT